MDAYANDPTRLFSNRVDDYVRYRPSYPPAVIDLLRQECGLTAGWVVADVGSGPGNLTRLFLDNGNRVYGVEPNREMREAGERLLRDYPRFTSIEGTAEETTLAGESVDLVTAGQAFHWFDPIRARREFARILRPEWWIALVWNERRIDGTPFGAAYEQLRQAHGSGYAAPRHRNNYTGNATVLHDLFGVSGYERATFENGQMFDFEGLRGRLLSSSYAPAVGQPGHEAMLAALRDVFDAHQKDGVVAFTYDTTVSYGRLR
jgi:SAM-dependent methyltransferase